MYLLFYKIFFSEFMYVRGRGAAGAVYIISNKFYIEEMGKIKQSYKKSFFTCLLKHLEWGT